MFLLGSAWIATDESRQLRDLVLQVIGRLNMQRKAFAAWAGLTEKQLSDQLTLKQPLNLWRLADIPGFRRALLNVLAEAEGCEVFERSQVKLILLVEASPKPMLRAALPSERKKEIA